MEIWKPVVGYEGFYEISNQGRVRRIAGGHGAKPGLVLKPQVGSHGYPTVVLQKLGCATTVLVHRLVAISFLGNPGDGREVNHKDSNRQNPTLENLEWVTRKGNILHAIQKGRQVGQGPIPVRRSDGVVFPSLKDAAHAIGGSSSKISNVLHGHRKSHKGYGFSYAREAI